MAAYFTAGETDEDGYSASDVWILNSHNKMVLWVPIDELKAKKNNKIPSLKLGIYQSNISEKYTVPEYKFECFYII